MAGITPAEGRLLLMRLTYRQLELVLICNREISDGLTYAQLQQPMGAGYAPRVLADAAWEVRVDKARYAPQRWEAGVGGWVGKVTGYALVSHQLGEPRILHAELSPGPPQNMNELDSYEVEPMVNRG